MLGTESASRTDCEARSHQEELERGFAVSDQGQQPHGTHQRPLEQHQRLAARVCRPIPARERQEFSQFSMCHAKDRTQQTECRYSHGKARVRRTHRGTQRKAITQASRTRSSSGTRGPTPKQSNKHAHQAMGITRQSKQQPSRDTRQQYNHHTRNKEREQAAAIDAHPPHQPRRSMRWGSRGS